MTLSEWLVHIGGALLSWALVAGGDSTLIAGFISYWLAAEIGINTKVHL